MDKRKITKKAPEKIDIQVQSLEREIKDGYAFLHISAKIQNVHESATGLKKGDVIKISYYTPTDEARKAGIIPPGDWAGEIAKDKNYTAFLSLVNKDKKVNEKEFGQANPEFQFLEKAKAVKEKLYRPSAVSASFKGIYSAKK